MTPRPAKSLTPLAALVLAGCVGIDEVQIAPGVFDISTPANGPANSEGRARFILDRRALMLWPAGYESRAGHVTEDLQGRKMMIWRVACR